MRRLPAEDSFRILPAEQQRGDIPHQSLGQSGLQHGRSVFNEVSAAAAASAAKAQQDTLDQGPAVSSQRQTRGTSRLSLSKQAPAGASAYTSIELQDVLNRMLELAKDVKMVQGPTGLSGMYGARRSRYKSAQ